MPNKSVIVANSNEINNKLNLIENEMTEKYNVLFENPDILNGLIDEALSKSVMLYNSNNSKALEVYFRENIEDSIYLYIRCNALKNPTIISKYISKHLKLKENMDENLEQLCIFEKLLTDSRCILNLDKYIYLVQTNEVLHSILEKIYSNIDKMQELSDFTIQLIDTYCVANNNKILEKKVYENLGNSSDINTFCLNIIANISKIFEGECLTPEEIIEIGTNNAKKAIEKFGYCNNSDLSNYIAYFVYYSIQNEIINRKKYSGCSDALYDKICKYKQTVLYLESVNHKTPSLLEIAQEMNTGIAEIFNLSILQNGTENLSVTINKYIENNILPPVSVKIPVGKKNIYSFLSNYDKTEINKVLNNLSQKDTDFLHYCYGKSLSLPSFNKNMINNTIIRFNLFTDLLKYIVENNAVNINLNKTKVKNRK